jgi:hypothetical protein
MRCMTCSRNSQTCLTQPACRSFGVNAGEQNKRPGRNVLPHTMHGVVWTRSARAPGNEPTGSVTVELTWSPREPLNVHFHLASM